MSNDLAETYRIAMGGYQSAIMQEQVAFQSAQVSGDTVEMVRASQSMASLRSQAAEYQRMSEELARPTPPVPMPGSEDLSHREVDLARKYGLTAQEVGVAKSWTTDPTLSDEDRVKKYTENRSRYQAARRDGSYRDDQGRVTK